MEYDFSPGASTRSTERVSPKSSSRASIDDWMFSADLDIQKVCSKPIKMLGYSVLRWCSVQNEMLKIDHQKCVKPAISYHITVYCYAPATLVKIRVGCFNLPTLNKVLFYSILFYSILVSAAKPWVVRVGGY